jgi:DNA polymerase III gamma/tau subunit
MVPRLKHIQTEESIDISDELLEQLAEISNGSMRYPLIQLEEFKALNREIKGSDLKLQKGLKNIKKIFKKLKQRKIPDAKRLVLKMYEKGNDFTDIAKSFHDFTMLSIKNELNFKQKAKCLISIGDAERNVNLGCNEFIQISRMIADISLLLQNTS